MSQRKDFSIDTADTASISFEYDYVPPEVITHYNITRECWNAMSPLLQSDIVIKLYQLRDEIKPTQKMLEEKRNTPSSTSSASINVITQSTDSSSTTASQTKTNKSISGLTSNDSLSDKLLYADAHLQKCITNKVIDNSFIDNLTYLKLQAENSTQLQQINKLIEVGEAYNYVRSTLDYVDLNAEVPHGKSKSASDYQYNVRYTIGILQHQIMTISQHTAIDITALKSETDDLIEHMDFTYDLMLKRRSIFSSPRDYQTNHPVYKKLTSFFIDAVNSETTLEKRREAIYQTLAFHSRLIPKNNSINYSQLCYRSINIAGFLMFTLYVIDGYKGKLEVKNYLSKFNNPYLETELDIYKTVLNYIADNKMTKLDFVTLWNQLYSLKDGFFSRKFPFVVDAMDSLNYSSYSSSYIKNLSDLRKKYYPHKNTVSEQKNIPSAPSLTTTSTNNEEKRVTIEKSPSTSSAVTTTVLKSTVSLSSTSVNTVSASMFFSPSAPPKYDTPPDFDRTTAVITDAAPPPYSNETPQERVSQDQDITDKKQTRTVTLA